MCVVPLIQNILHWLVVGRHAPRAAEAGVGKGGGGGHEEACRTHSLWRHQRTRLHQSGSQTRLALIWNIRVHGFVWRGGFFQRPGISVWATLRSLRMRSNVKSRGTHWTCSETRWACNDAAENWISDCVRLLIVFFLLAPPPPRRQSSARRGSSWRTRGRPSCRPDWLKLGRGRWRPPKRTAPRMN